MKSPSDDKKIKVGKLKNLVSKKILSTSQGNPSENEDNFPPQTPHGEERYSPEPKTKTPPRLDKRNSKTYLKTLNIGTNKKTTSKRAESDLKKVLNESQTGSSFGILTPYRIIADISRIQTVPILKILPTVLAQIKVSRQNTDDAALDEILVELASRLREVSTVSSEANESSEQISTTYEEAMVLADSPTKIKLSSGHIEKPIILIQQARNEEAEKRRLVCYLILANQELYVEYLRIILNDWIKPLNTKKKATEKQKALMDTLFGDLEKVIDDECNLLKSLQNAVNESNDDIQIGETLLSFNSTGEIYTNYLNGLDTAMSAYTQLSEYKGWKTWCITNYHKWNSPHYGEIVEKPILHQHYLWFLLEALKSYTSPTHPDLKHLENKIEKLKVYCKEEMYPILPLKAKVLEVQDQIVSPFPLSLASSHRLYGKEGYVDYRVNNERQRGYIYALNDVIIITKLAPGKFNYLEHHYVDYIEMNDLEIDVLNSGKETSQKPKNVQPLLIPKESLIFRIESFENSNEGSFIPHIDLKEDLYKRDFLNSKHYNFVHVGQEKDDSFVYSVMVDPILNNTSIHKALKTTPKNTKEVNLNLTKPTSSMQNIPIIEGKSNPILDSMEDSISSLEPGKKIAYIQDTAGFSHELLKLEEVLPQKVTQMKIGVLYCSNNQKTPHDMLKNEANVCSPSFWNFMDKIGKRINLEGFEGYRGDFSVNTKGETYHSKWNDIEIMYHIAPWLDEEGRRRFIGNDMAVLIFIEEGDFKSIDPADVNELGQVTQIFAFVHPKKFKTKKKHEEIKYQVSFLSRSNLDVVLPRVPEEPYLDEETMRELILSKTFNSVVMARYCPPFNRLFSIPRAVLLQEILEKFPTKKKKKDYSTKSEVGFLATLPLPEKVSFQLIIKSKTWDFYCDTPAETVQWTETIKKLKQDYSSLPEEKKEAKPIISTLEFKDDEGVFSLEERSERISILKKKSRSRKGSVNEKKTRSSDKEKGKTGIFRTGSLSIHQFGKSGFKKSQKHKDMSDVKEILLSEDLSKLKGVLEQYNCLDLIPFFVDLHNYYASFHTSFDEDKNQAMDIYNKWFESKNTTIADNFDSARFPISNKYSQDMFDAHFTEVQTKLQMYYFRLVQFNLSIQPKPPPLPSKATIVPLKKLPTNFSTSFVKTNIQLISIFRRYVHKLGEEDLLKLYIETYNFRFLFFFSVEEMTPRAQKIIELWDKLCKINEHVKATEGVLREVKVLMETDINQSMFECISLVLEAILDQRYQDLIEFHNELKNVTKG